MATQGTGTGANTRLESLKVGEMPDALAEVGEKHNRLCDLIGGMTGKKGVSAIVTSGNIVISLAPDADTSILTGTNTPIPTAQFTLYNASQSSTLKIGIANGLVNGISPTYTGASPSGVLSDSPPPLLTITATTYFWLKCVGVFGTPDTYTISVEHNTTGTVPSGTAISGTGFTSFFYIGYVAIAGGVITGIYPSNNGANLSVDSFGSTNIWWR